MKKNKKVKINFNVDNLSSTQVVEKKKFKFSAYKLFLGLLATVLVLYALSILFLLLWGLMTSFKVHLGDFTNNVFGLPKKWMFSNYKTVFESFSAKVSIKGSDGITNVAVVDKFFTDMLGNTLLYSIGCSFMATLVPCIVGYAMARYKFKFSGFLYYLILFTMALPIVGNLASEIDWAKKLGFYDTFYGIWIMSGTFAGSYTLVFFATFKMIPQSYSEAAEIDGASELSIMLRIILPLAINTFGAIMLIKFVAYWNEYESAMIYLVSKPTLSYGLYYVTQVNSKLSLTEKLAGCMIVLLPILVVFIIFQDKLMGNVSMGGIKG